jgi:hypothetical protein
MAESFILNFSHKGVMEEIVCTLRVSTFTYQFLCTIGGTDMIMEKDDEGNLRVMEADPFSNKSKKPDPALVRSVMDELERVLQQKA